MATLITDIGQIKSKKVRLVTEAENLVIDKSEALSKAISNGLDLVLVQDGDVPVVKLVNFTKFEYERQKNIKQNKPKKPKTVQIGAHTQQYDLERFAAKAEEFIAEGHPTNVRLEVTGRDKIFRDIIAKKLSDFVKLIPSAKPGKVSIAENDKKVTYYQTLT